MCIRDRLEIDSEIITYTGVTTNTFTGCSRGFSGITSYRNPTSQDELIFTNSGVSTHSSGSVVNNLSVIFLQEFLKKVKRQINPGFEERSLDDSVNERLFTKQVKDFYSSKGTDQSFEILFRWTAESRNPTVSLWLRLLQTSNRQPLMALILAAQASS